MIPLAVFNDAGERMLHLLKGSHRWLPTIHLALQRCLLSLFLGQFTFLWRF